MPCVGRGKSYSRSILVTDTGQMHATVICGVGGSTAIVKHNKFGLVAVAMIKHYILVRPDLEREHHSSTTRLDAIESYFLPFPEI